MSDVFISYARSTAAQANAVAEALRAAGYTVWLDEDLPAHRPYAREIEAQLKAAKAALVIWSAEAVESEWVLSEANRARADRKLVQVSVDGVSPPMPFDQIQCADVAGWTGETTHAGWRKVAASVAELVRGAQTPVTQMTTPVAPAAPPLPDKPSIAVLPFSDPSGAVEGDYFADGMVDEIVAALSRFPLLFVIASSSGLSYRERERDVRKIGRELGVRYLLEGSVRRSGARVRIGVGLVEAEAAAQIWSERFEGTLDDVFALQDEVANAVAARLEPTIEAADLRRSTTRPTEDLGAYDLFLRGQRQREDDQGGYQAAIALFEQAVARDPAFAGAWAQLAWLHASSLLTGMTADRAESARKARDAIRQAMQANADDAVALARVAFTVANLGGDERSTLAMADRALALNPGSAECWTLGGLVSCLYRHYEQALERLHHALRLSPRAPNRHAVLAGLGVALVGLERFDEALPSLNEAITLRPYYFLPIFALAIALSHLDRIEEAKAALARLESTGSLNSIVDTVVAREGSEIWLSGLRRPGFDV